MDHRFLKLMDTFKLLGACVEMLQVLLWKLPQQSMLECLHFLKKREMGPMVISSWSAKIKGWGKTIGSCPIQGTWGSTSGSCPTQGSCVRQVLSQARVWNWFWWLFRLGPFKKKGDFIRIQILLINFFQIMETTLSGWTATLSRAKMEPHFIRRILMLCGKQRMAVPSPVYIVP